MIRLYFFVDLAYKLNARAFSVKFMSVLVLYECFRCGNNSVLTCPLAPPGQCISQLCASSYEDDVLSLLLGPSGPETLPELLSECDAWVLGQPGRLGHRMEQLPR